MTANRQEVLDSCPFTQYEFIAKDQLQYWPVADTQKDGQPLWIVTWPGAIHHNFFLCYLFSVPTKQENYLYYPQINMEELEGNTWYASEMYGKEVTRPILGLGYDVLGRKSDIFFTIILIMLQFSITI